MRTTRIILAAAGAAAAVVALIALAVTTAGLRGTVAQLQHTTRTQAAQLASQGGQIKGGHRDLITCSDLHRLDLQDTWGASVNSGGYIDVQQTPVALPAHCING